LDADWMFAQLAANAAFAPKAADAANSSDVRFFKANSGGSCWWPALMKKVQFWCSEPTLFASPTSAVVTAYIWSPELLTLNW